jgi:hypothetical protein
MRTVPSFNAVAVCGGLLLERFLESLLISRDRTRCGGFCTLADDRTAATRAVVGPLAAFGSGI